MVQEDFTVFHIFIIQYNKNNSYFYSYISLLHYHIIDVEVSTDPDFDIIAILEKLIQAFPDKGFDIDFGEKIVFGSWKLNELKQFLKVTNSYKGHSKSKKR